MASSPRLRWPAALKLTPDILHGALADWGIPASWARADVSVWTRLYRLDDEGRPVTRGANPQVVAMPPPGYDVEVIDAALWKRLPWGVLKAAWPAIRHLKNGKDRHVIEITSATWDTGGRVKPTWSELKEIVVTWWLGAACGRLTNGDRDGSIDHCVRWARDRAVAGIALPFGVRAKPGSLMHLREIKPKADGTFPKTVLLNAAGAKVEITSAAAAKRLADAALVERNRLESARNMLAQEALTHVLKAADKTGGLGAAETDVARLNARTRALDRAHSLLGPAAIDAEFAHHLATV